MFDIRNKSITSYRIPYELGSYMTLFSGSVKVSEPHSPYARGEPEGEDDAIK